MKNLGNLKIKNVTPTNVKRLAGIRLRKVQGYWTRMTFIYQYQTNESQEDELKKLTKGFIRAKYEETENLETVARFSILIYRNWLLRQTNYGGSTQHICRYTFHLRISYA